MSGQTWLVVHLAVAPATSNGFVLTVNGASAVRLDLARMGIDPGQPITATVTTDGPLEVRLGTRVVSFPAGTTTVAI
jgi:hypothetical protein